MQYGVSQAGTLKADTTTKPQTEIVQQWEDPVKDLMAKYKVAVIEDIEVMNFGDMVAMLREAYSITTGGNSLTDEMKKIISTLELCIKWENPAFDIASLKAPSWSQEETSRLKQELETLNKIEIAKLNENQTKKENIAKIDNENQTLDKTEIAKLNENQTLDKTIENMKKKSEALKAVADRTNIKNNK